MFGIRKAFSIIFGKPKNTYGLLVKFYTDSNMYGEHGRIVVSHMKKELDHEPVSMVFVGLSTPPCMTLELMQFIWKEAEHQGYQVHHLLEYGTCNEIKTEPLLHRNRSSNIPKLTSLDMPVRWFVKENARFRRVK